MAKKSGSHSRRRKGKFKLKSGTIYTIFALGLFAAGLLCLLSFSQSGDSMILINAILTENFGWGALLFPFVIFFFGLFLLQMKMYLSRINVSIGFFVFFLSIVSLSKAGTIGMGIFMTLADILTNLGASLVFFFGMIVGVIVFFDTSIDEIIKGMGFLFGNTHRLIPTSIFKSTPSQGFSKAKPMEIKGGTHKDMAPSTSPVTTKGDPVAPTIIKKDPEILSDKLVSNMIEGGDGVWEYPPLSLLSDSPGIKAERGDVKKVAGIIEKTLQSFGIDARVAEVNLGPAVTQYALELSLGTKVSKITSLANDLALATEAPTGQIRIEAPIPGRNLVGIEIPNRSLEVVTLRTMLAAAVMQKSKSKLTVSMGLDVSGAPVVADITKMPHVLVAGTTGSGKSVLINAFITSLLFRASPAEVKLILVDPKRVEFTGYNGIPHLLTPVIVEPEKILSALKWATSEMDRRYKLFSERGVRNIEGYNELSGFQALPYIVVVIDELADLMMFAPVEVEDAIARIAQMARATGIHLVIATQ